MNYKISISIFLLLASNLKAQDSLITYSKILQLENISKNEIFDKTLIWCSKNFRESKSAINVKERDGGIIVGKAFYFSHYKIPKRKDSINSLNFINYFFDWLIEVKDSKLRFTASNIFINDLDNKYPVTSSTKAPYEIWLQPKSRTEMEWKLSKEAFIKNLDKILQSLYDELQNKTNDW